VLPDAADVEADDDDDDVKRARAVIGVVGGRVCVACVVAAAVVVARMGAVRLARTSAAPEGGVSGAAGFCNTTHTHTTTT
jgi:hypothetical protein